MLKKALALLILILAFIIAGCGSQTGGANSGISETDLIFKCQNGVSSILKAPSTAKYPLFSEWKISKTDQEIIVQSYVDSQNSFGAMIRSDFQVIFTPDGNDVTSFIFEGKEYIN